MGMATLNVLLSDTAYDLVLLVRESKLDRKLIRLYLNHPRIQVVFGDLTVYEDVLRCVTGVDVILHCGALVSPLADDYP